MSPADKEKLDMQARAQQMKINTRLTALQAAQTLMGTPGFKPTDGGNAASCVDMVNLLAIATEVEKYILGDIEEETKKAIETLNRPRLHTATEIPKGLRP